MNFLRGFGLPELLILLVVIILLFGPGRISKVTEEIGKGIRSLREGINSNNSMRKRRKKNADPYPQQSFYRHHHHHNTKPIGGEMIV